MRHVTSGATGPPTRPLTEALLLAAALISGLAATPTPTLARCARIDVPVEAARSLYVFEGRLESIDGLRMTFVVTAVWQGAPPERVTVATSARRPFASAEDLGASYLVFASGADPLRLNVSRCGSSAPLPSAASALAELEALGRRRDPR